MVKEKRDYQEVDGSAWMKFGAGSSKSSRSRGCSVELMTRGSSMKKEAHYSRADPPIRKITVYPSARWTEGVTSSIHPPLVESISTWIHFTSFSSRSVNTSSITNALHLLPSSRIDFSFSFLMSFSWETSLTLELIESKTKVQPHNWPAVFFSSFRQPDPHDTQGRRKKKRNSRPISLISRTHSPL